MSYYPTYAVLDEIVSYGNYKKLTIFIDLKNTLQTTYMEHAIVNIVENSKQTKFMDTSIFSSVISFLSFHRIYGMKRGIDINFIIFFETGQSYYHLNISKEYKISRKIDDLYGLDRADRELFWKVLHTNFRLVDQACNKMPNVKVVRMSHLEADFIPYYLLSRKKLNSNAETGFITYSNDHDLWQCAAKDSYIYSKAGKNKQIIRSGNIMSRFLKKPCEYEDVYLPLAMAVIGDPGDDVTGVAKVGPTRFLGILPQIVAMTGNMSEVYKRVENNQDLFNPIPSSISNKYLQKVIDAEVTKKTVSNNLKLVSFELISRAIENPSKTEMIDKRKTIEKILDDDQVYPLESLKTALTRTGVFLEESSIDFLYI